MAANAPRSQIWILGALVGAVAILFALWKVIGTPSAASSTGEPGAPAKLDGVRSGEPASVSPPADRQPETTAAPIAPAPVAVLPEPTIRLHGSILDARSRTPLAVASEVRIVDDGWEELSTKTLAADPYVFPNLHPGQWDVIVTAPGFRTLRAHVGLDVDATDWTVDFSVEPAHVIRVRLDASLEPDLSWSGSLDHLVIGNFGRSLARKASSVEARSIAYALPASVNVFVVATFEDPGSSLDPTADWPPKVGRFVARDTGNALPAETKARLRVLGYAKSSEAGDSPRLADGSSLADLPQEYCGVLELSEPPPLTVSLVFNSFVLRNVPIPPGALEVSIPLSAEEIQKLPAVVRLKVVDAETNGMPPKLRVGVGARSLGDAWTKQDADGSLLIPGLLPGPTRLEITAFEREGLIEQVFVRPGVTTDLGTYRMQPFAMIEAKVVDDEGQPMRASFNVFPLDRYEAAHEASQSRFFRSTASGDLRIDSVGRGRNLIVANDEGNMSAPVLADTTLGQTARVQIRVSKATDVALRLRVDPPPAAHLGIRTKADLPVTEFRCRSGQTMRCRLAPGNYVAELRDGETWLWTEGFSVGSEPVRRYLPR